MRHELRKIPIAQPDHETEIGATGQVPVYRRSSRSGAARGTGCCAFLPPFFDSPTEAT